MTHAAHSYPPRSARLLTAVTALAAVAAAALLLVACASPAGIAPSAKPIDAAALTPGASSTPDISADWWKAYGDGTLDGLVERALRDAPTLAAAQSRVQRAQAAVDANRAADRPQVNGSFEATRQRYTENGLIPPPLAGTTQTVSTLQLSGSWELDIFGRQRAAIDAAVGGQRAAEADAQAARVLLASNVVRQYVQLARGVEQREVLQRTLAQREEILSLIRQRVDAGLDTNVELRQGEGALPEMRQQIEALDEQNKLTRHALAALTAQGPGALDALSARLNSVQLVALPDNVPADLLGRRADITAARWRIEAATKDMQSARAQFYPSVNLLAFAGFSSIGLNNLIEAGSRQYGIGPAIHLPIFDAGRLRANYRGKAVDVDSAVAAYNGAVLDALHEVADPITSLQSIANQQREQAQAQASAESAYDLALQRYRAGLGTYLTVLTAETNVLAQRRSGVDLRARTLDAQAQLARALGGGYVADKNVPTTTALATTGSNTK
jgi:NodT family efflux transporter outer membrane factor (OMF) lipoprotein